MRRMLGGTGCLMENCTSGLCNGERETNFPVIPHLPSIPLRPKLAPLRLMPFLSGLCHPATSGSLSEEGTYHIQWLGSSFQSGLGSRASMGLSGQAQELWSCCRSRHSELGSQCGGGGGGKGSGASEAETLRRHIMWFNLGSHKCSQQHNERRKGG